MINAPAISYNPPERLWDQTEQDSLVKAACSPSSIAPHQ